MMRLSPRQVDDSSCCRPGVCALTSGPPMPHAAYDKRKYMWKLLYTHMLGYDVDFGHKQAMDLIASPGYAEKQVGYVACSVFLNERDEFLRLVINSVRNDLISRNETFQCLALDFVSNGAWGSDWGGGRGEERGVGTEREWFGEEVGRGRAGQLGVREGMGCGVCSRRATVARPHGTRSSRGTIPAAVFPTTCSGRCGVLAPAHDGCHERSGEWARVSWGHCKCCGPA